MRECPVCGTQISAKRWVNLPSNTRMNRMHTRCLQCGTKIKGYIPYISWFLAILIFIPFSMPLLLFFDYWIGHAPNTILFFVGLIAFFVGVIILLFLTNYLTVKYFGIVVRDE